MTATGTNPSHPSDVDFRDFVSTAFAPGPSRGDVIPTPVETCTECVSKPTSYDRLHPSRLLTADPSTEGV